MVVYSPVEVSNPLEGKLTLFVSCLIISSIARYFELRTCVSDYFVGRPLLAMKQMRSMTISLDGLLDYDEEDREECTFEVS